MRRIVTSTLVLILAATACSSAVDTSAIRTVDIGQAEASNEVPGSGSRAPATLAYQTWPDWALANFDDCHRLLDHIQSEALSRVGANGLDHGQYRRSFDDGDSFERLSDDGFMEDFGEDMEDEFLEDIVTDDVVEDMGVGDDEFEMADDMGADDMGADDMGADDMGDMGPQMDIATDDGGGAAGVEFSGTNVQVTGVDEPDIVKTDGRRIIAVSGSVLTVVDVTGPEPVIMGHVALSGSYVASTDGAGRDMDSNMDSNMDGDMGVDMGAGNSAPTSELLLHGDRVLAIRNDAGGIRPEAEVGERSRTQPEIVVIDEVLLDGVPRRGRTMRIEGRYVSSRSVGGTARIVINSFPDEPGFVRPLNRDGISLAAELNRQVVEQTTLSDWLPDYSLVDAEGSVLEAAEPFLACDQVHVPGDFGGFGTASVMTIDLTEPLAPHDGAATFAVAETVYATLRSLYVATSAWVSASDLAGSEISGRAAARYATSIHKFSFGTGGSAAYEASGSVAGHLLNQFALHERAGHLFVAATEGPPGRFGGTVSRIVALGQRGDRLVEVGEVGDLGRGERIFAVRYIGDRAYVVTFRRVDPLYVVDLSDPARLAVLGELKIPGFSSYLHPIGDGLLVGVGRDVTEWGRDRGLKISLFDVADASDPREIDTWTLRDAHTDIGTDHRSFLWWARDQLMVLPLTVAYWREAPSGGYVFKVTRSDGLEEFGRVDHSRDGRGAEPVRRSLVIGEDLWTMSASLLQRNDLGTLDRGARVPLPATAEIAPDPPAAATGSATADPVDRPVADEAEPLATVTRFPDCPGLLAHIRAEVADHVGAYGFERGRFGRHPDRSDVVGDDVSWRVLAAGDDSLRDFIDSDGRRIVTAVGDSLTVVDVSGAEPNLVGRLPLDLDRTVRLMTLGNRVLVVGEIRAGRSGRVSGISSLGNAVVVREFLVGDQLRRGRSLYVEGRLLDARPNAGRARIVVRSAPKGLGLVYAPTEAAERVAAAGNRQSIERSTLKNWLPSYALVAGNGLRLGEGQLLSCDGVVVPDRFSGVGFVSALTIDLNRSITSGTAAAIFGEDAATLATGESLYVATEPWPASKRGEDTGYSSTPTSTSIHRFTLSHWWRAAYAASGAVGGSLIGSSPLHEFDGHLFVAVEEGAARSGDDRGGSRIVTLEGDGDSLVTVGRSDDLGGVDPIAVVRYAGDRAFTFGGPYWEPIQVVDLHDPAKPSPAGALSGLSHRDYGIVLRPIGTDQLATVEIVQSRRAPSTKVASYTVVDGEFHETGTWTRTGISSRAATDPESLLWSDRARLLVVPVAGRFARAQTRGAAVFSVTPAGDLSYVGHIGPHDRRREDGGNEVFRSLTVGGDLWTLSASYSRADRGANWLLQSYDLDTLERRTAVALND
ncbi:MAG: beta-propeller domain-containing protein [bacterium]|nr:beta-propeller domain-containing protein [bacterium]